MILNIIDDTTERINAQKETKESLELFKNIGTVSSHSHMRLKLKI